MPGARGSRARCCTASREPCSPTTGGAQSGTSGSGGPLDGGAGQFEPGWRRLRVSIRGAPDRVVRAERIDEWKATNRRTVDEAAYQAIFTRDVEGLTTAAERAGKRAAKLDNFDFEELEAKPEIAAIPPE